MDCIKVFLLPGVTHKVSFVQFISFVTNYLCSHKVSSVYYDDRTVRATFKGESFLVSCTNEGGGGHEGQQHSCSFKSQ